MSKWTPVLASAVLTGVGLGLIVVAKPRQESLAALWTHGRYWAALVCFIAAAGFAAVGVLGAEERGPLSMLACGGLGLLDLFLLIAAFRGMETKPLSLAPDAGRPPVARADLTPSPSGRGLG